MQKTNERWQIDLYKDGVFVRTEVWDNPVSLEYLCDVIKQKGIYEPRNAKYINLDTGEQHIWHEGEKWDSYYGKVISPKTV